MRWFTVLSLIVLCAFRVNADTLWLGATTTLQDSGFLDTVIPAFESDTGHRVRVLAQPTGLALRSASDGNFDVVLAHSPELEAEFVERGDAVSRIPFMRSRFVVIGPKDDPAKVAGLSTRAAMLRIHRKRAETDILWIAREDLSGTSAQENLLWQELEITNEPEWRLVTGQGMGATLNIAVAKSAYGLAELATFLAHQNKGNLRIMTVDPTPVENIYSVLRLNPDRFADRDLALGDEFIAWLLGARAQALIADITVDGVGVFSPAM